MSRSGDRKSQQTEKLLVDSPSSAAAKLTTIHESSAPQQLSRFPASPGEPLTRRTLLHYRILEMLGAGGMGTVYLAEDEKLGRRVALKVLPAEMAIDEDRLQRFRREARAVAALNHPNIVTIYSVEETDGIHFLTMELVEGKSLDTLIPSAGCELGRILEVAAPLVDAVAAAHEQGIIHRDLKPANIMVSNSGIVKVLDFGLAKRLPELNDSYAPAAEERLEGSSEGHATAETLVSEGGRLLGTLSYMSPEQVQGKALDARSDLFSLGILFYEMSTGQRPFQGPTAAQVMAAIIRDTPRPATELRTQLPARLGRIIERCLEKDRERRYPRARDVWNTLLELKRELDSGESAIPAGRRTAIVRHTVGRDKERAELHAGLEAVAAGRGQLLCVVGEPGIGKTTLVEDFLDEVIDEGPSCTIARGRCSERLAGAEAYLPLLEILGDLLRSRAEGSVAETMRKLAPWWYVQVAPLSTDEPSDVRLIEGVESTTQERMKRELAAFLYELSHQRPAVLFIDDLHWSDLSTVDLLAYLASKFDTLRLLIVATYRPEELVLAGHPFLQIRSDLRARGLCREIIVRFLNHAEIEDYLALEFPEHDLQGDFPKLMHEKTEGSPLFMVGLVRYLRDRGVIVEAEGRWILSQSLPDIGLELPESVRSMIQRKIDQLSEGDRRLLVAAGVQGSEFDSAVVGQVLALDAVEVEERLQALDLVHGLVRLIEEREFPDRTLTVRYRFVHVLYQNALYASLTPTRRASLSKAVAEALCGHYGKRSRTVAAELAILFEAARDPGRAAEYFSLAARNALRILAYQEAIVLARRGLEALLPLPDVPGRTRQELQLQHTLGTALMITKGYASAEVEQTNARKRELIQKLGRTPQTYFAMPSLVAYYFMKAELQPAVDQAEELLRLAQAKGESALLLTAHDTLGLCLMCRGAFSSARAHLESALALYDPSQHRRLAHISLTSDLRVTALCWNSWTLWILGYPDQSLEQSHEAVALSKELSHPFSLALALHSATFLHQFRGETQQTRQRAEEGIILDTEHGFSLFLAGETIHRGWAVYETEPGAEGIALMQQGMRAWKATGSNLIVPYWLALTAHSYGRLGQTGKGLAMLAEALEKADETAEYWYAAELHRLTGKLLQLQGARTIEVEGSFCRALDVARRQRAKSLELRAAVSLSRLWRSQGKRGEARKLLSEIYGWFSEGFDTGDLKAAKALLEEIS